MPGAPRGPGAWPRLCVGYPRGFHGDSTARWCRPCVLRVAVRGDPEAAPRGAHTWTVCLTGATPPRAVSRPGTGGTGHPASPAPGSAEAPLPGRDVGEVHVGRDHHPDAPLLALQGTKEEPCSLAATTLTPWRGDGEPAWRAPALQGSSTQSGGARTLGARGRSRCSRASVGPEGGPAGAAAGSPGPGAEVNPLNHGDRGWGPSRAEVPRAARTAQTGHNRGRAARISVSLVQPALPATRGHHRPNRITSP